MKGENNSLVPEEVIISKIYLIRGRKVMLDADLAILYNVKTGNLNKAVKRNSGRFPDDFMFQLTKEEFDDLIFHSGISSWGGTRKLPFAFTEQGVAMLSSVLRSNHAILVNIRIILVFTRMRQFFEVNNEIMVKLQELQKNDSEQDRKILLIFDYLKQLEQAKQEKSDQKERKKIGFKRKDEP
jgi:hypothetical protein